MQLTTIIFLLFFGNYVCGKQFTEDEYALCFDNFLCKLNHSDNLRTMLTLTGPKLREMGYQWLVDEGFKDAADTDEFWKRYPETKCKESEEKRREVFDHWTKSTVDHWTFVCQENPFGEECSKCDEAMVYVNNLVTGYFATGDCESTAQMKAREEAEKLSAEVPPSLKKPSFG